MRGDFGMKYAENNKEFIKHIISILEDNIHVMDIHKEREIGDGVSLIKIFEADGNKYMPATDECFNYTKQEIINLRCDEHPLNYDRTINNLKNKYLK